MKGLDLIKGDGKEPGKGMLNENDKDRYSSRKVGMRPTIAFLVDRILGISGYQSEVWRGIVEAAHEQNANEES